VTTGGFTLGATATGNSGWLDGSALAAPMSVVVSGIVSGDKVDVRVSNQSERPQPTDTGVQLGSDVTVDGVVAITTPFRWILLRRTVTSGGGKVSAYLAAYRPPLG
jgi:hypothetical protein